MAQKARREAERTLDFSANDDTGSPVTPQRDRTGDEVDFSRVDDVLAPLAHHIVQSAEQQCPSESRANRTPARRHRRRQQCAATTRCAVAATRADGAFRCAH